MQIASHDTDFFLLLERLQTPRHVFDAQADEHEAIDARLARRIEALLVPLLGRWEQSSNWFHNLDYYGDGIRSLTFSRRVFPSIQVQQLQRLLEGEHECFCLLCIVTDEPLDASSGGPARAPDDYLAIFAHEILATRALAAELSDA